MSKSSQKNIVQLCIKKILPEAVYIVAIDLLIFDLCLCPMGVEEVAGTYPVYSVHRGVISISFSRYCFPFAFLILQACHINKNWLAATKQRPHVRHQPCVFSYTRQKEELVQ